MLQSHTASLLIILATSGVVLYKSSYLKNKRIFRVNLHQILFLFVIPSIAAILIHNYAFNLIRASKSETYILPDSVLFNVIFLSMLFIFAAKAIHTVTKALFNAGLRPNTKAGNLNQYLHLTFSHNFLFSSTILLVTSLTLLEINHDTDYLYKNVFSGVWRGLILGLALIGAMYQYTRADFKEEYPGVAWSDLKLVFAISWVAFVVLVSLSSLVDIPLRQYQFLLPTVSALALVNGLNILLSLKNKIK